jgi:hypothetical protein
MSTTSIIIQSLAAAFIISHWLVDEVKRLMLRAITWQANRQKAKVPKDDNWANIVSTINQNVSSIQRGIVEANFKPFSCISCMSFWACMLTAFFTGQYKDMFFVGVVGFAAGMILDRILMRHF